MLAKMHAVIKSALSLPAATAANDNDDHTLQLAAAALLLEVSAADFRQHPEEQVAIMQALKKAFALTEQELSSLLVLADQAAKEAVSLHQFTAVINEHCSYEEKVSLLLQMWRVAFADQRIDKYEDYRIRKLADLLYLSHKDFIQAKHRAESGE